MITRYYGPRDRYKIRTIPIYGSYFQTAIVHSMENAWNKRRQRKIPGILPPGEDSAACCSWYRSRIVILFDRSNVTHEIIAHEIFHATHRILDWVGIEVTKKHHESAAHLNGHLNKLVYQDMKRWKIKVK